MRLPYTAGVVARTGCHRFRPRVKAHDLGAGNRHALPFYLRLIAYTYLLGEKEGGAPLHEPFDHGQ